MGLLTNVTRMFGRTSLILSKYSPEILQGVGLVTMIGSVVSAGVITANRAEDILENHRRKMEEADEAVEIAEEDGIDGLIWDNGDYFDEFVCEELRSDVVELVRALIKEIRK